MDFAIFSVLYIKVGLSVGKLCLIVTPHNISLGLTRCFNTHSPITVLVSSLSGEKFDRG